MLRKLSHIRIDPGEKIVLKTRKHWIILVRDTLGTAALGILIFPLFALIAWSGLLPIPITISPAFVTFASALWLLLIWLALSVLWTNYYLDVWLVTNHRVFNIEQVNLFNRRVATWGMERVQEITVKIENPLQVFFDYGTMEIQTAGPTAENATMEGIPHPDRVRTIILEQISGVGKRPACTMQ